MCFRPFLTNPLRWFPRKGLLADRRGAVAVEFAICASAFFALLIACAQTVLIFFAQQALQTGAEAGARYIMTGQAKQAAMSAAQFRTYACGQMPRIFDCNNLIVDVRTAADFSNIDTDTPGITYNPDGTVSNAWQFNSGGSQSIMIVRLMYFWNVQIGPLSLDFSNAGRGKRLLIGTMVFKSEPYRS